MKMVTPHLCAFAPCDAGTRLGGSIPPSEAREYRMSTHIPRMFHF
jgi:hypothetical protein